MQTHYPDITAFGYVSVVCVFVYVICVALGLGAYEYSGSLLFA